MSAGERTAAAALLAAIAGCGAFITAYATGGGRLFEGAALALAAAGFCAAALAWAFGILPNEQVEDAVDTYPSQPADRAAALGEVASDLRAVSRSKLLLRTLYVAMGSLAATLIVPMRSLGPAPGDSLFHTKWRPGKRLVREDGRVIYVDDLNVDSALAVFPENALGDSQSQATLVRMPEDSPIATRGYVAYSRLCTHAGCPVALYRASAKQLLCPCHQSVFDVARNGEVVSGPADHALPRLPIEVGPDGALRATGDFPVPVGPGFWERG